MGEVEAYYKILPNLNLKYSSIDTIFIPTDKKELRSKFLVKLDEGDAHFDKGAEVIGGKDGRFIEKADIIDKFCRREIKENDHALGELSSIQFAKMYDPMRRKKTEFIEEEDSNDSKENVIYQNDEEDNHPWKDEEDRVANYYVTCNPLYHNIPLPKTIKIKNPREGEIPIYEKRTFPKAARFHKKREDTDPHRFFLSELMLYTGYTDEQQLHCDNEDECRKLYLSKRDAIQYVKSHMLPFAQGVEEARYYVEEAVKESNSTNSIGNELDPELEKEIIECQESEEIPHPDFEHLNPDELEFNDNLIQVKKTLRTIELKTSDEMLKDARTLDEFQQKALHVAVEFAQNVVIARKNCGSYPSAPLMMIHGGAGSGKSTLIKIIAQYVTQTSRR